jgi:hypothetical protein
MILILFTFFKLIKLNETTVTQSFKRTGAFIQYKAGPGPSHQ